MLSRTTRAIAGAAILMGAASSLHAAPFPPIGGGPPNADVLFDRFDDNGDDALTEDEVFAPMWARLQNADANGDGKVTRAEYDDAT
ncbi:MAG: hypothetical protein AAF488_19760 [Planctomycetota bacterium]